MLGALCIERLRVAQNRGFLDRSGVGTRLGGLEGDGDEDWCLDCRCEVWMEVFLFFFFNRVAELWFWQPFVYEDFLTILRRRNFKSLLQGWIS